MAEVAFVKHAVRVGPDTISVTVCGSGPAVILLHGYAEDGRMWDRCAHEFADEWTTIVPDLPGIGESSIPSSGLDMKTAAARIHGGVAALGFGDVSVVGHDIGLMVAYAYAAMYREQVKKLALFDAFLPGVAGWEAIYNGESRWHFRFHGPTPEALVAGRERLYLDHFWNDFAADPERSVDEVQRQAYTSAYARDGRMAAGFAYFANLLKTAGDFALFAQTPLDIPVLTIAGEHAAGTSLGAQARAVAHHVTDVVIPNTGHWLLSEQPDLTIAELRRFLSIKS